jgi:hypothetical protein
MELMQRLEQDLLRERLRLCDSKLNAAQQEILRLERCLAATRVADKYVTPFLAVARTFRNAEPRTIILERYDGQPHALEVLDFQRLLHAFETKDQECGPESHTS